MRYKLLGRSGLRVSEICLGAMTFGEELDWGASKDESRKVFDAYVAAGGNFIDTANMYMGGTSERLVGEFVGAERDRFVIATKYTVTTRSDDPNAGGNQRKSLVQSLERSLQGLGMDYVDLFWVHAWDSVTPIDEVMRALDDQVRAGKVLYVGISDAPAWIVSRANTISELRGWTPFVALQIEYSLMQRTPERELLPMADALELAITPWGPLGSGVLTGKYRDKKTAEKARLSSAAWARYVLNERNLAIGDAVVALAKEIGRTPAQVALNWVRQRKSGTTIPIIGARTLAQLQDNLGCLDFELDDKQVARLDEASRIELGFPHDFLQRETVQGLMFGEKLPLIDRPHQRA